MTRWASALLWVFIVCSPRTGLYQSVHHTAPRHGWTCAVSETGCQLEAVTGEAFAMRFTSRLRYVQSDGTHVTIHCHP
jgi:hypothetical protein